MFPNSSFAVVKKKLCCFAMSGKNFIQKIHSSPIHNKGTHFAQVGLCFLSKQHPSLELAQHHSACFCVYRHTVNNSRTSIAHRFSTKLEFACLLAAKEKGLVDHSAQCFKLTYMSLPAPPPFTTPPRCHMAEDLQKKRGAPFQLIPNFWNEALCFKDKMNCSGWFSSH